MRRLIVNADDFGFNRDVNAGIVEAHRDGILTATTLMANGDAFEEAATLAHQIPSLDVGCHLVLVQGRSVFDPSRALPATLSELVRSLARRELPVYEEAAAQVRRLVKAGIQPSHIDTHKHTHLLPTVLDAVAQVAKEFQIPWVRRPFDFGTGAVVKQVIAEGMKLMAPSFTTKLQGLRTTDHFTGFLTTGTLTEEKLIETLERLPPGLTEFMCHPGKLGPELSHAATRLKESRALELKALLSPRVRHLIEDQNIELTTYRSSCIT